jgi:hypothetical protein
LGNEYEHIRDNRNRKKLIYYRMHGFLDPAEGTFAYITYDDKLTDIKYLAGTSGDRELLELQLYIQAPLSLSRQSYFEIGGNEINQGNKSRSRVIQRRAKR